MATQELNRRVNPVLEQDRAFDLFDNWKKYGYVMFPQQRCIYEHLASRIRGSVLEAGCGSGQGSAILDNRLRWSDTGSIVATDKVERNIRFARCLYPWIEFYQWDILEPMRGHSCFDVVVAVEVIEHVADVQKALANLVVVANKEVWLSTPNGKGKPRPPENPQHVCEYTQDEMIEMLLAIPHVSEVYWYNWETFESDYNSDPIVYKVILR